MKNLAILSAWGFAAAFMGAAVLGLVSNPLVGVEGVFVTNMAHNLVHLATAIAFVAVALIGAQSSIRFMQAFGVVYLLTGLIGFVALGSQEEGYLLGFIHINQFDNVLHFGLGVAIAAASWVSQRELRRPIIARQA
ncbi:MAG: DUF4383 domain-containing protein [Methylocystis sp.]